MVRRRDWAQSISMFVIYKFYQYLLRSFVDETYLCPPNLQCGYKTRVFPVYCNSRGDAFNTIYFNYTPFAHIISCGWQLTTFNNPHFHLNYRTIIHVTDRLQ